MFFPKLRRRAKWVFLLLAVVFLGGYLVFSVGTGAGSGIGDYLSDIFNRQPGAAGPSVDEARERLADNPQDPQAQLELARALQTDGQVEQAIAAYERYTTTRPRDEDGLRALASLYGLEAAEAQRRFEQASGEAGAARRPLRRTRSWSPSRARRTPVRRRRRPRRSATGPFRPTSTSA
jgi:tetratricopeptide (TPR) repeat protein